MAIINYNKFDTAALIHIWQEAHQAAYNKPAPWNGQCRETVIQELEACLYVTTLKERVNNGR